MSKWFNNAACCTNFNLCATTGSIQSMQVTILMESALNSMAVSRALSFDEFKAEIERGRPVIMGYTNSFAGHVVVGFGYDERTNTIEIHDPYFGTFVVPFSASFKYGTMTSTLSWTSTIKDFGLRPSFCCTAVGKLGPYQNTTTAAGGQCWGTDLQGIQRQGTACF